MPRHINRDAIILEAIKALEHGVKPRIIAERHGISYNTLSKWLRYNQDAYVARHKFIDDYLAHLQGKQRDWHKRMRLERLSLYRQLHGMPPNPPQPRKSKRQEQGKTA